MQLYQKIGTDADINVLDLGCKQVAGDPSNYEKLRNVQVAGIDIAESDALFKSGNTRISATIGDGNVHTLYICELETCSSLFKPNISLMSRYNNIADWLKVREEKQIQTTKLNNIVLPFNPDYIKSDMQGSDLMAIKHGSRYFESVLAVEVEVEFIMQYENQPLFSEVELALRDFGLSFYTFTGYGSRLLKPMADPNDPFAPSDQWMWAHAVFFRMNDYAESAVSLLKLATIAHDVYAAEDLTAHFLQRLDDLLNSDFCSKFMSFSQIAGPGINQI